MNDIQLPEDVRLALASLHIARLATTKDELWSAIVVGADHDVFCRWARLLEREATAHQQYLKLVSHMAATGGDL